MFCLRLKLHFVCVCVCVYVWSMDTFYLFILYPRFFKCFILPCKPPPPIITTLFLSFSTYFTFYSSLLLCVYIIMLVVSAGTFYACFHQYNLLSIFVQVFYVIHRIYTNCYCSKLSYIYKSQKSFPNENKHISIHAHQHGLRTQQYPPNCLPQPRYAHN